MPQTGSVAGPRQSGKASLRPACADFETQGADRQGQQLTCLLGPALRAPTLSLGSRKPGFGSAHHCATCPGPGTSGSGSTGTCCGSSSGFCRFAHISRIPASCGSSDGRSPEGVWTREEEKNHEEGRKGEARALPVGLHLGA